MSPCGSYGQLNGSQQCMNGSQTNLVRHERKHGSWMSFSKSLSSHCWTYKQGRTGTKTAREQIDFYQTSCGVKDYLPLQKLRIWVLVNYGGSRLLKFLYSFYFTGSNFPSQQAINLSRQEAFTPLQPASPALFMNLNEFERQPNGFSPSLTSFKVSNKVQKRVDESRREWWDIKQVL